MILYTPMVLEEVLAGQEELANDRKYISYQGRFFCVDKSQTGYQLVSMSSTDPNDYMNEQFFPGTFL